MTDSLHPVRAYRLSQDPPVTLQALASDVGITKASLSRIETGKLALSQKVGEKLSRRTGIPLAILLPDLAKLFDGARGGAQ